MTTSMQRHQAQAGQQLAVIVVAAGLLDRGQMGASGADGLRQAIDVLVGGQQRRVGRTDIGGDASDLRGQVGDLALGVAAIAHPSRDARRHRGRRLPASCDDLIQLRLRRRGGVAQRRGLGAQVRELRVEPFRVLFQRALLRREPGGVVRQLREPGVADGAALVAGVAFDPRPLVLDARQTRARRAAIAGHRAQDLL